MEKIAKRYLTRFVFCLLLYLAFRLCNNFRERIKIQQQISLCLISSLNKKFPDNDFRFLITRTLFSTILFIQIRKKLTQYFLCPFSSKPNKFLQTISYNCKYFFYTFHILPFPQIIL